MGAPRRTCTYWQPTRHTLDLGWGPWEGGRLDNAGLSPSRSPLGLLDGWELISLIRGEGALTAKLALRQSDVLLGDGGEHTDLELLDGTRCRWANLASALRDVVHVLPLFGEQRPHWEATAIRAFDHGSRYYEEYEFWRCTSCQELYDQEWLSCPVCRRLSRQFFGRPA